MNLWHDLPPGPDWPRVIYVVVEIPKKSRTKYEYDEQGGFLRLDRVLFSSLHYPGDYGFIPQTLHTDGDPLDVLVLVSEPTFPGCVIEARPLGIFHLLDKGQLDDKILAVPHRDPLFSGYRALADVPPHFLEEVAHFFSVYKDLESVKVVGQGWEGRARAFLEIEQAVARYQEQHPASLSASSTPPHRDEHETDGAR
jgi:inorganic pyrophosphatase